MKVYIQDVKKTEEHNVEHNCDVTNIHFVIHPVLSIDDEGKAKVSQTGVEPLVMLEGRVIEHTKLTQALRDVANMIDGQLDGKTSEEFIQELGPIPAKIDG